MNTSRTISFREAKSEVAHALREQVPSISLLEWEEKVGVVLMKKLEDPIEQILFELVDSQDLSQQHKKEMYDSFQYHITINGIELLFSPKTPLMNALENGASPRSLEDSVLSRNYKVSANGTFYKVIPLKSKEPVRDADRLVPKVIIADSSAEEQFFKEITILLGDKEKTLAFGNIGGTEIDVYNRTQRFITKVHGVRRSQRIYLSTPRGKTVDSISRFTVFRTITNDPAKQWRPIPGFPGLKLADELVTKYTQLIKDETQRLIKRFPG